MAKGHTRYTRLACGTHVESNNNHTRNRLNYGVNSTYITDRAADSVAQHRGLHMARGPLLDTHELRNYEKIVVCNSDVCS